MWENKLFNIRVVFLHIFIPSEKNKGMNIEAVLLNAIKEGIIFNITTSSKDTFNITVNKDGVVKRYRGNNLYLGLNNLLSEDTT